MPDSDFDAEVKARMRELVYILDADLPPLPDSKQWGGFRAHLNCKNRGLDKFHRWLDPFLAPGVANLTSLKSVHEVGPNETYGIVIALRRLIKTRKKNELPHDELLHALFGLCLMRDFSNSFVVDGIPMPSPTAMVEFVDIDELSAVRCDYATVGYQHCGSLLKTDIKWLVAAFGEPALHKFPDTLFQYVRHRAISRYCWAELRRLVLSANSFEVLPALSMQDWLEGQIKSSIARQKESQAWLVQKEQLADMATAAQIATSGIYAIVDLETTALNPKTGEIFELCAVLVDSAGAVAAEFSTLFRVNQRVPTFIAELRGVVPTDVNPGGCPLAEALAEFFAFVGSNPIFIHHASINFGFLREAANQVGLNFSNPTHDISFVHPMDFSAGETYEANVAAAHIVGASESSQNVFAAARAALNELTAARIATRKGRGTMVLQAGVLHWSPTGLFPLSAAGTSFRHDAIAKLAKNTPGKSAFAFCTATLAPENTNIHDSNAIMILIQGVMVGYLPKNYAEIFRAHFKKIGLPVQITTCDAVITNGLEAEGKQYSYTIELDIALDSNAPKFISPTYNTIERVDPNPVFSKQDDGRYFVELRMDCGIFEDADRRWRLMTWTTDHWDTINYYLGNKKNAGLGHLLFAVPKHTHKELFGDKEPDAKLEIVKGRMALVSLMPV